MRINKVWLRLGIFPVLGLLLATIIIMDNINLLSRRDSITFTYLESLRNGNAGYGEISDYNNDISLASLKPGDILLGGWPNCAYGSFSHAGLYLGNNEVLEGYVDSGITINTVDHYRNYAQACILRVQTSANVKKRAIEYARQQEGKIFYPVAFKNGERYWNCSKIIWKAYMEQNIDLDNTHDLWIAPVVFCKSPNVKIIGLKGEI
ncbi:MAG: YiiX/YebB-like N1pC/P60 family cysteine hydrolase [Syntrophomonas sp.]